MLVKDVMVPASAVRTAKPDDQVRTVAAVMCTQRISGMPVVDDEFNLLGIISEKDVLNALLPSYAEFLEDPIRSRDFESMEKAYANVLNKTVRELMTSRLHSVSSDEQIMKAASCMGLHKFRRMPVVDNGKLAGVISMGDIHKAIFKRELGL